jgi:hypothetical protein
MLGLFDKSTSPFLPSLSSSVGLALRLPVDEMEVIDTSLALANMVNEGRTCNREVGGGANVTLEQSPGGPELLALPTLTPGWPLVPAAADTSISASIWHPTASLSLSRSSSTIINAPSMIAA